MITGSSHSLKLVAVTKGRSAQEIEQLLRTYPVICRIGENRIEEAKVKFEELKRDLGANFARIEKHFIGKLQSRKIREIAEHFDVIQSVENFEQAQKLSKVASELNKTLGIFIEVNLAGLSERSGAKPEEVSDLLVRIQTLPHLNLLGVMGMATQDPQKARDQFKLLKSLQGSLGECSMGMSSDYQLATEEGSTMLRLGTLLFEEGLPKSVLFE